MQLLFYTYTKKWCKVSCFLQIVNKQFGFLFFPFLKKKIINAGENHKMWIGKKKEKKWFIISPKQAIT